MMHALQRVCDADHEWLYSLHNDPIVLHNITNPTPITPEGHAAWWVSITQNPKQLRLIYTVNGERVGFTKFYDIDLVNKNCVLGADIHASHRGNGYAKTMWSLMLDKCFNEFRLERVALTTAEFNKIAVHTYEKLGFLHEGRLTKSLLRDGVFHDQLCMYMLRSDWLKRQQDA